jgi:ribosomal protein S18 acetylase RimI-like enzyme
VDPISGHAILQEIDFIAAQQAHSATGECMSAPVTIRIRLATPEDYPGFLSVAQETHEHHVALLPNVFRSVEVAVPHDYFAQMVTGQESCILLAERAGAIVGYATLQLHHATRDLMVPHTVAEVGNFGVSAAYRRTGVGRFLFAACREQAKAMGARDLNLSCWEANQEAMHFYESMGMRVSRRWLTLGL